jgi:hypothetical protein
VAEYHRLLDDEVPDPAFDPVVHVAATDAGPFWLDKDIVGGLELRNGPVFIGHMVFGLEDEGRILFEFNCYSSNTTRMMGLVMMRATILAGSMVGYLELHTFCAAVFNPILACSCCGGGVGCSGCSGILGFEEKMARKQKQEAIGDLALA